MSKIDLDRVQELLRKKKEEKEKNFFYKLGDLFERAVSKIKFPEKIEISNLKDIEKTEIPKSFTIDNVEEIGEEVARNVVIPEPTEFPGKIEVSNVKDFGKAIKVPKPKDFPKSFSVNNLDEIKIPKVEFPENIKKLSFEKTEKLTKDVYDKILLFFKAMKDGIFISNKKPSESIPVRMVSKDGKEFESMKHVVTGIPTRMTVVDEVANSLVTSKYDYVELGWTGSNVTSVVYKLNGASGTTVSTLTLTWDGDNLTSITKS